jgi:AcrR family transcriptional regulator
VGNPEATPSARQTELLEAAYRYALAHGLAELSLRPLAAAIGSSPRVLLYLFGSKDGLIRALLARARSDELQLLGRLGADERQGDGNAAGLARTAEQVWSWLAAPEHRSLLTLWVEGYARSLVDPDGPWARFALATVEDWLALLAGAQEPSRRHTAAGSAERTLVLAVLRGGLLDLLATGDLERTTAAVRSSLATRDLATLDLATPPAADQPVQTPEVTARSTSSGW